MFGSEGEINVHAQTFQFNVTNHPNVLDLDCGIKLRRCTLLQLLLRSEAQTAKLLTVKENTNSEVHSMELHWKVAEGVLEAKHSVLKALWL